MQKPPMQKLTMQKPPMQKLTMQKPPMQNLRLGMLLLRMPTAAGCALLGLLACKADIPDGVYACDTSEDCPPGYSCRAEAGASQRHCFAGKDSASGAPGGGSQAGRDASGTGGGGRSGSGGAGSGAGSGGGAGSGAGSGGGAGTGGSSMPEPVAPTRGSFASVGQRRGGGGFALYDDGFEQGERLCTADQTLCVTGGFSP